MAPTVVIFGRSQRSTQPNVHRSPFQKQAAVRGIQTQTPAAIPENLHQTPLHLDATVAMTSAAHLGIVSLLTLGASAATTDPAAAFSHSTAPTSAVTPAATPAATSATTAGSTTASPTARSGQPRAPTSDDSLTKTTAMIMIGVGAPLALGLLVTITIWGYMLGRRHELAEMDEQRKERERRERRRKRVPATVRYELEGKEVLEMGTQANCAEMDDDQRPPVEMEGLREPAELPAGSWVKLLGALR